jgi:4-aminobutyrate aminotransferase
VKWIEEDLFRRVIPPEEVAAIFVEPIQGEGGYVIPPVDFHRKLRALCDKYEILYVADEVQTGMGRTGKMFALEHFGIEPDIMTLAKGIASGMPLGAMISKSTVMNWVPGSHASTFGGNPVSCAAALKTIDLLEGGLVENARVVGTYLKSCLEDLQRRFEMIGDVRGLGLMVGVELVRDREKKTKAIEERDTLIQKCFRRGLLLLGCGENTVRMIPPLVITREEIDRGLAIFEESLREIERGNLD